jgi:uncharacterized phage infection (PIP) family protein YhgE
MRIRGTALGAVLVVAALSVACGGSETRVIDQYFNALKANDNTTLTSFAAVAFDKKVDAWKIKGSSPETRSPAILPDLAKKVSDLEAELAANKKAAGAYSLEKYSDIDKVKDLQKAGKPVPGNLKEVADKWAQFNDKDRELKTQLGKAKAALEREKRNATLSVGQQDDVANLSGEVVSKTVDVDLTIAGQVQPYVMTLRKYELSGGSGPRQVSRWVIQNIAPKG